MHMRCVCMYACMIYVSVPVRVNVCMYGCRCVRARAYSPTPSAWQIHICTVSAQRGRYKCMHACMCLDSSPSHLKTRDLSALAPQPAPPNAVFPSLSHPDHHLRHLGKGFLAEQMIDLPQSTRPQLPASHCTLQPLRGWLCQDHPLLATPRFLPLIPPQKIDHTVRRRTATRQGLQCARGETPAQRPKLKHTRTAKCYQPDNIHAHYCVRWHIASTVVIGVHGEHSETSVSAGPEAETHILRPYVCRSVPAGGPAHRCANVAAGGRQTCSMQRNRRLVASICSTERVPASDAPSSRSPSLSVCCCGSSAGRSKGSRATREPRTYSSKSSSSASPVSRKTSSTFPLAHARKDSPAPPRTRTTEVRAAARSTVLVKSTGGDSEWPIKSAATAASAPASPSLRTGCGLC